VALTTWAVMKPIEPLNTTVSLAMEILTWLDERGVDANTAAAATGIAYAVGCAGMGKSLPTSIDLLTQFYKFSKQNETH
jgi:hypothetical protein